MEKNSERCFCTKIACVPSLPLSPTQIFTMDRRRADKHLINNQFLKQRKACGRLIKRHRLYLSSGSSNQTISERASNSTDYSNKIRVLGDRKMGLSHLNKLCSCLDQSLCKTLVKKIPCDGQPFIGQVNDHKCIKTLRKRLCSNRSATVRRLGRPPVAVSSPFSLYSPLIRYSAQTLKNCCSDSKSRCRKMINGPDEKRRLVNSSEWRCLKHTLPQQPIYNRFQHKQSTTKEKCKLPESCQHKKEGEKGCTKLKQKKVNEKVERYPKMYSIDNACKNRNPKNVSFMRDINKDCPNKHYSITKIPLQTKSQVTNETCFNPLMPSGEPYIIKVPMFLSKRNKVIKNMNIQRQIVSSRPLSKSLLYSSKGPKPNKNRIFSDSSVSCIPKFDFCYKIGRKTGGQLPVAKRGTKSVFELFGKDHICPKQLRQYKYRICSRKICSPDMYDSYICLKKNNNNRYLNKSTSTVKEKRKSQKSMITISCKSRGSQSSSQVSKLHSKLDRYCYLPFERDLVRSNLRDRNNSFGDSSVNHHPSTNTTKKRRKFNDPDDHTEQARKKTASQKSTVSANDFTSIKFNRTHSNSNFKDNRYRIQHSLSGALGNYSRESFCVPHIFRKDTYIKRRRNTIRHLQQTVSNVYRNRTMGNIKEKSVPKQYFVSHQSSQTDKPNRITWCSSDPAGLENHQIKEKTLRSLSALTPRHQAQLENAIRSLRIKKSIYNCKNYECGAPQQYDFIKIHKGHDTGLNKVTWQRRPNGAEVYSKPLIQNSNNKEIMPINKQPKCTRRRIRNSLSKLLSVSADSYRLLKCLKIRTSRASRLARSHTVPKMPIELQNIVMNPRRRRVCTIGSKINLSIQFYKEDDWDLDHTGSGKKGYSHSKSSAGYEGKKQTSGLMNKLGSFYKSIVTFKALDTSNNEKENVSSKNLLKITMRNVPQVFKEPNNEDFVSFHNKKVNKIPSKPRNNKYVAHQKMQKTELSKTSTKGRDLKSKDYQGKTYLKQMITSKNKSSKPNTMSYKENTCMSKNESANKNEIKDPENNDKMSKKHSSTVQNTKHLNKVSNVNTSKSCNSEKSFYTQTKLGRQRDKSNETNIRYRGTLPLLEVKSNHNKGTLAIVKQVAKHVSTCKPLVCNPDICDVNLLSKALKRKRRNSKYIANLRKQGPSIGERCFCLLTHKIIKPKKQVDKRKDNISQPSVVRFQGKCHNKLDNARTRQKAKTKSNQKVVCKCFDNFGLVNSNKSNKKIICKCFDNFGLLSSNKGSPVVIRTGFENYHQENLSQARLTVKRALRTQNSVDIKTLMPYSKRRFNRTQSTKMIITDRSQSSPNYELSNFSNRNTRYPTKVIKGDKNEKINKYSKQHKTDCKSFGKLRLIDGKKRSMINLTRKPAVYKRETFKKDFEFRTPKSNKSISVHRGSSPTDSLTIKSVKELKKDTSRRPSTDFHEYKKQKLDKCYKVTKGKTVATDFQNKIHKSKKILTQKVWNTPEKPYILVKKRKNSNRLHNNKYLTSVDYVQDQFKRKVKKCSNHNVIHKIKEVSSKLQPGSRANANKSSKLTEMLRKQRCNRDFKKNINYSVQKNYIPYSRLHRTKIKIKNSQANNVTLKHTANKNRLGHTKKNIHHTKHKLLKDNGSFQRIANVHKRNRIQPDVTTTTQSSYISRPCSGSKSTNSLKTGQNIYQSNKALSFTKFVRYVKSIPKYVKTTICSLSSGSLRKHKKVLSSDKQCVNYKYVTCPICERVKLSPDGSNYKKARYQQLNQQVPQSCCTNINERPAIKLSHPFSARTHKKSEVSIARPRSSPGCNKSLNKNKSKSISGNQNCPRRLTRKLYEIPPADIKPRKRSTLGTIEHFGGKKCCKHHDKMNRGDATVSDKYLPVIEMIVDKNTMNVANTEEITRKLRSRLPTSGKKQGPKKLQIRLDSPPVNDYKKDHPKTKIKHCTCCVCRKKPNANSGKPPEYCTCCICRYRSHYGYKLNTKKKKNKSRSNKQNKSKKNGSISTISSAVGNVTKVSTKLKHFKSDVESTIAELSVKPCFCRSHICKKETKRLKDIRKIGLKAKASPECVCGSKECKLQYIKQNPYYKEKVIREKNKKKQMSKKNKSLYDQYFKEDALELKRIKKQDKTAMKIVKQYKNNMSGWVMLAENVSDVGRFSINSARRMITSFKRAICHPRYMKYRAKQVLEDPSRTATKFLQDTGYSGTAERVKRRCSSMPQSNFIVSAMESHPMTNYLCHMRDKDPRKKLIQPKKREEEVRGTFVNSLRKKPCLWLYRLCPKFYPHCLNLLSVWRQFTDIVIFLLAIAVWSPCIICMEFCRSLMCCLMCAGGL